MNTQTTQPNSTAQNTDALGDIGVMGALGRALVRKRSRIAQIDTELDELRREGIYTPFTAEDLFQLESVGYLYDFHTGDVIDTWHAIDVQAEVVHASAETMQ